MEASLTCSCLPYLFLFGSSRPTCASMDSYRLVRCCVMLGSDMLNDDEGVKNSWKSTEFESPPGICNSPRNLSSYRVLSKLCTWTHINLHWLNLSTTLICDDPSGNSPNKVNSENRYTSWNDWRRHNRYTSWNDWWHRRPCCTARHASCRAEWLRRCSWHNCTASRKFLISRLPSVRFSFSISPECSILSLLLCWCNLLPDNKQEGKTTRTLTLEPHTACRKGGWGLEYKIKRN